MTHLPRWCAALTVLGMLHTPSLAADATALAPMGLGTSIAYGGFADVTEAAVYWPSYYGLDRTGLPPHYNQLASLTLGFTPMMGLLVGEMKREGVTWKTFGQRMRFKKPKASDWAWAALATGIGIGINVPLSALNKQIHYPIPDFYEPALGPYATGEVRDNLQRLYGSERIKGNWGPAIALTVGNALSVTSEELYWRGLMLPRMEASLGKWAWVVQGLLWAPSHGFKYWEILPLFAATLPLSALGQKTGNTTVVWVTHMAINTATGVGALYVIAAVGVPETTEAELSRRVVPDAFVAPASPQTPQLIQFQGRF